MGKKRKIKINKNKQPLIITNRLVKLYRIHYVIHYYINCYDLVTNIHSTYLKAK